MKIRSLEINGIARIKNRLYLEFNNSMNIICGINGTCKTTVLECITHCFSHQNSGAIKKNASAPVGKCVINIESPDVQTRKYEIKQFVPTQHDSLYSHINYANNADILYFKTNRVFHYSPLNAIPKDSERNSHLQGEINDTGIQFHDFKGWFVHRFLYSYVPNALSPEQISNLETVKRCFNVLDRNITFSRVKADSNDIMVNSQQGEIYFEYLSAGYKACLYVLLGIIKEIEFRFKSPIIAVNNFDGVILIDEIDLHLHPIWQTAIVKSLKEIFPKSQIIVTTHSPHIIQSADPAEVIPLVINDDGDIEVNKIDFNEFGFQGWTVEEILQDVMGMENTRSPLYIETMNAFDKALSDEDDVAATKNYKILQKMLHPESEMKKILDIRMVGVDKGSD